MKGKAEMLDRFLEATGLGALLLRVPAWRGAIVLTYHRIAHSAREVLDPGVWSASPDDFDAQVRLLAQHFDVVRLEELGKRVRGRDRCLAITFDDGYRDNWEHALPILRAHAVPATFFLTTGFLDGTAAAWWDEIAWMVACSRRPALPPDPWLHAEVPLDPPARQRAAETVIERYKALSADLRETFLDHLADVTGSGRRPARDGVADWMTWEHARELAAAGMTIGAHTVTHPILAGLPCARQREEIEGSLQRVETETGRRPSLFSYPVGLEESADAETRRLLAEAGIRMAFLNYGGRLRSPSPDPLRMPRVNVWRGMRIARFRAMVTLPQAQHI
jgi:peptidoglycan/xylan/chitin deacetylase (PgdA/CDA1 family)